MRQRLTGWGWAAAGAVTVILLVLTVNAIITTLKQRSDEKRITHIERVVISLQPHHRVRRGVRPHQPSSTAHQQPSPQDGGSTGGSQPVDGNPAPVPANPGPPPSPAPTPRSGQSNPLPAPVEPAPEEPTPVSHAPQPVPALTETVTGAVEGVTETACSATAALKICP